MKRMYLLCCLLSLSLVGCSHPFEIYDKNIMKEQRKDTELNTEDYRGKLESKYIPSDYCDVYHNFVMMNLFTSSRDEYVYVKDGVSKDTFQNDGYLLIYYSFGVYQVCRFKDGSGELIFDSTEDYDEFV